MDRSVHLTSLGCRLNEAELESWSRDFQRAGLRVVDSEHADLLVVNTCAVTQEAVRKSRKLIRRVHRDNPEAKLVVTGCYASLAPEEMDGFAGVDLLVANQDKARLVEQTLTRLDWHVGPQIGLEQPHPLLFRRRQRAFVKVQDGCRYRCSFCVVTLARGPEQSRPMAEVVAEVRQLESQGVQEIVLTGVHLGGYGAGLGQSLTTLVQALLADTGMPRIRLGSLEPWELDDDFWSLFDNRRLMPHLHLPLQSGSDAVLRRMARRCRRDDYARLLERGRERVSDLNVTTDVIVGFPGESEDDWRQTCEFVERMAFGHVHIFAYSRRPGTKAAQLDGQVTEAVKRQRSARLHEIGGRVSRQVLQRGLGNRCELLLEQVIAMPDGGLCWSGYSRPYLPVRIAHAEGMAAGQVVPVSLTAIDLHQGCLLAESIG